MAKLINWQNEKMQHLVFQKEYLTMNNGKHEHIVLKSVKDNFNEIEIQKLKKIDDNLLGLSIFYLQHPEKYFSDGKQLKKKKKLLKFLFNMKEFLNLPF